MEESKGKKCSCGKTARVKGLCFACYARQRRGENPEKAQMESKRDYIHYLEKHKFEIDLRAFFRKMGWRPLQSDRYHTVFRVKFNCAKCHQNKKGYRIFIDGLSYCKACQNQIEDKKEAEEIFRTAQAQEAIDKIDPFGQMRKTCTKLGTCDILHFHHELLKDDPERMKTEFLVGMICGEDKAVKYIQKRARGVV